MLLLAALAIALQTPAVSATAHTDTTNGAKKREVSIEIGAKSRARRDTTPRRIPVTPQHLATAFADPAARTLLQQARTSRLQQDSALTSYDASSYERISAGMSLGHIGRDRLIFRQESVARVRWERGVGAYVDLQAARSAVPIAPPDDEKDADDDMLSDMMSPIPYYPGWEPLVQMNGDQRGVRKTVDERDIVHPLAEGSEAYYTYASGDSLRVRLPGGTSVQLRELRVRPREPKGNLVVGSFWFDTRTGQLVRAAYRLAVPYDVWAQVKAEGDDDLDSVPVFVRPMISPMLFELSTMTVEYGLYDGKFWLPRERTVSGTARVSLMRVPVKWEERFDYRSVNALQPLPKIVVASSPGDTASMETRMRTADSLATIRRAQRDSVRHGLKPKSLAVCDTAIAETRTMLHGDARIPVSYTVPCDHAALAKSPLLSPSIYDDGEDVAGEADRQALVQMALGLSAQAHFGPQPVQLQYGPSMLRYNRVEGLSVGLGASDELGDGYSANAVARLGVGDWAPNLELTLQRSTANRSARLGGYTHLVAANDWGDPLSFGASLSAALFGRDNGFYYRASGVEFGGAADDGAHLDWHLFLEHQSPVNVNWRYALTSLGGHAFGPNISAWRGTWTGFSMRLDHSHGLNPHGFRVLSAIRVEAAASDSAYGRGSGEITLSDGFGKTAVAALTLSSGNSVGAVPPQRLWYLGGAETVRGQVADITQSGNAYWLTRAEVGNDYGIVRPTVFADLGWVGDRNRITQVGRPMSGVGVGASLLDGMVRFDLARGLYPRRQFRLDAYLEARF